MTDSGKIFNCGGNDHLACDSKIKKNNPNDESYEAKYKRMIDYLKRKNNESKFLVAKEEWVDDEESSDEEIKKDVCLMATTGEFIIDKNSNSSKTFKDDLAKAASDSKF